ncbi:MAG: aminopeptidase N [Alphaproteobacteria bacterium]|nr:aminopeptidase N [Alphaproteobacteria bacterium]
MDQARPQTIRLEDYRPPAFGIDSVDLRFDLDEQATTVTSRLHVRRLRAEDPLELDGEDLELVSLSVDGHRLSRDDYALTPAGLRIPLIGHQAELEVVTRIKPQDNTRLSGLYKSGGNFCSQCEAEGFRRITYFLDRPDVLSRFTVTIVADKARYPVLLSNGNLVREEEVEGGRHLAVWEDPYLKPCYLFALVAGDLAHIEDRFRTASGRDVALRIYTVAGDEDKCAHAMASLKKAMAWDEETFGLEYDLDVYNIVAVRDFNAGAMENKSLNLFNSAYVLATPETATDANFDAIESVIAHEYFHNWTGNRVTCRDWFQLSLKEGLTVFRDQQFSADMQSAAEQRIQDVKMLRARQFPEDAGPQAHPVRPHSYIEINNFYTATVYEKGAEVIRMIQTLIGKDNFRKGMDLYIARNDGTAATVEDFVSAMADASGTDLDQFMRWYGQAGTPRLEVRGDWNQDARTYVLTVRQTTAPTPGQPSKQPLHIPLAMGLLGRNGAEMPLVLDDENDGPTSRVLELREPEQTFVFTGIGEKPVPSLLRGFSAPVTLDAGYSREDLAFLMRHDTDAFARWEAGQALATDLLLELVAAYRRRQPLVLDETFLTAFESVLTDQQLDPAFVSLAILLPSQAYLGQQMEEVDVEAIEHVHRFVRGELSRRLHDKFLALYHRLNGHRQYSFDAASVGRRSLKNICLAYLMREPSREAVALCRDQFRWADNMTDSLAALTALANADVPERQEAINSFYEKWSHNPLVVDKWLSVQAMSELPDTPQRVRELMQHESFSLNNPNRVRSLVGAFTQSNQPRFHEQDGEGYRLLADVVLALDRINPSVAARMMGGFDQWRRYDSERRKLMRAEIERVLARPDLSRAVYEIASKALAED